MSANGMKAQKPSLKTKDYLKAIHRADREVELEDDKGFTSKHKVHKSKKDYDRKKWKNHELEDDEETLDE